MEITKWESCSKRSEEWRGKRITHPLFKRFNRDRGDVGTTRPDIDQFFSHSSRGNYEKAGNTAIVAFFHVWFVYRLYSNEHIYIYIHTMGVLLRRGRKEFHQQCPRWVILSLAEECSSESNEASKEASINKYIHAVSVKRATIQEQQKSNTRIDLSSFFFLTQRHKNEKTRGKNDPRNESGNFPVGLYFSMQNRNSLLM